MKELLTLRLKVGQLQQLLTLPLIAVRTEFIIKDMAVVTSIRQATISRTYFRRCVLLWNIVLIVAILGKAVVLFAPRAQPPVQVLPPDFRVLIAKPAVHLHRPSRSQPVEDRQARSEN